MQVSRLASCLFLQAQSSSPTSAPAAICSISTHFFRATPLFSLKRLAFFKSRPQECYFCPLNNPLVNPRNCPHRGQMRPPRGAHDPAALSCYNSSIGKTRIKMQTFRIIAKNPCHENAASKLVPAAVRFFVLAKFVRSKQHSALLYETAVLLFFAVINAQMRDDIISSCRQRFSSFLLAALVRSRQRGTSLL